MEILGRFNGQITIAQERKTGARLYVEEGVSKATFCPAGRQASTTYGSCCGCLKARQTSSSSVAAAARLLQSCTTKVVA